MLHVQLQETARESARAAAAGAGAGQHGRAVLGHEGGVARVRRRHGRAAARGLGLGRGGVQRHAPHVHLFGVGALPPADLIELS